MRSVSEDNFIRLLARVEVLEAQVAALSAALSEHSHPVPEHHHAWQPPPTFGPLPKPDFDSESYRQRIMDALLKDDF